MKVITIKENGAKTKFLFEGKNTKRDFELNYKKLFDDFVISNGLKWENLCDLDFYSFVRDYCEGKNIKFIYITPNGTI